ncbi:MAG: ABC transporter ATP-binding protein [Hyphomicrobiaceae bacterium]|nr:MAG: ABC transporter ATP-binding protein [Hyphomicrobiaceae bacterium]
MLELKGLSKHFGGVKAVDGVDLRVRKGEIVGLIGPNGSGKSTTVNLVCGVYPATAGRIMFEGADITRLAPHKRVRGGLARTFQNIRLFQRLTVWENLWVARNTAGQGEPRRLFGNWVGGQRAARASVEELLEFAGLHSKRDMVTGALAFGEQRRLEFARALAAEPRLLLLDEPAAGMNLEEIGDLRHRIVDLRRRGLAVLLIEHVMELVMGVSDRIAVLNFGRKIAEGSPAEIQAHPDVQAAYLGDAEV